MHQYISRTEVTLNKAKHGKQFTELEKGQEYWAGFAIYLDDNYQMPKYGDILFQIHGVPDRNLKEAYRNPTLNLHVTGTKQAKGAPSWGITTRGDSKRVTVNKNYTSSHHALISPVAGDTGRWVKWVVHFKTTYNNDGFVELWKDGKKVYRKDGIATAFNDAKGGYFKIGSYKWSWRDKHNYETIQPAKRQSYLDAVRFAKGPNRYNDVAP